MIPIEKAIELILKEITPLGLEKIDILNSLGRVAAEDIYSKRDIPSFDNSAMDGYAVRFIDIKGASHDNLSILNVIEDIPAGYTPNRFVSKGEAVRIMTGAPVPQGADTVVMVEDTEKDGDTVKIFRETRKGRNIRRAGEDVKAGDLVMSRGTLLRSAEIGMMASVGRSFISVYQVPRVAILSTGDELVDVDGRLNGAKIISTNSYTLISQVKECNAIPIYLGIARDTKEEIKEKLKEGKHADIIISSGGVSVGDYDLVKDVLKEIGADIRFWKVAMRPGQPLAFGVIGRKPIFGLPGNPVSSMVSFEQFIRPSILKMSGFKHIFRPVIDAVLKEDIYQKRGRKRLLRSIVSLEDGEYYVRLTGEQGSGILMSMVKSNGLIIIPEEGADFKAGEKVRVQLLNRDFELSEEPGYASVE
ncbi:MAG: molybdopterin molybdotransferase MoeA [Thermodesulfobacteriota bacterium]|nr:molybdopterin molybdotransferase MoeA [Thermodesulfobacteriota bacterium]